MKDYTNRLQVLERFFCVKSIPTFDQFKTKWAEADPLSRSVLAALAESGDFDGWGKSWSRYMTAVRGYLLQMGELTPMHRASGSLPQRWRGNAYEVYS